MSELHSTDAYVTRQPSSQILNMLRSPERTKTIQEMCALLRACTFAAVKLKGMSPTASRTPALPTTESVTGNVAPASVESTGTADSAMSSAHSAIPVEQTSTNKDVAWPASTSANAKALKTVLVTIPDSLKSFLQGEH